MKITIELNLENEDDLYKFKLLNASEKLHYVLKALKDDIRNILKHGSTTGNNLTEKSTLSEWQEYFHSLLKEEGLNLEELY